MTCQLTQKQLQEIAFGSAISAAVHQDLRAHLANCSQCQAEASELLLLAAATHPSEANPPSEWESHLRDEIEASERRWRFPRRQVAAALVFLALGAAAGFWLRSGPEATPPAAQPSVQHLVYELAPSPLEPGPSTTHTYEPFAYEAGFLHGKTARLVRD